MIHVNFALSNPWHKNKFKNLFNKAWSVSKHKVIEFQILYADYDIVEAKLNLSFREDHAGLALALGIFGYSIDLHFYDTRHWDTEKGAWEKYDDNNTNS